MISLVPVEGIPEVAPGDELADLILGATQLEAYDVVVVTQKVVSKAEGRLVPIDPADLAARRELVLSESVRVLRDRDGLIIAETRHGFICANAGVDLSNVADGQAALLPLDPDRSARHLRDALRARTGLEIAVIITDTFGRPWRTGLTDVAIGCAGIAAVVDLRRRRNGFCRRAGQGQGQRDPGGAGERGRPVLVPGVVRPGRGGPAA
jgi:coenzyme F420-0:L-glutamate ligase / coenzyme F420-1:gamma-L-glutamate ligase